MKKIVLIILFSINTILFAQETDDFPDDEFYDFGMAGGITVYAERSKEYDPDSIDAYVLNKLNGYQSARKQFIETDFLEEAGFRRSAAVRYRNSTGMEKTISVLHGLAHLFSLGIVPIKPFFEIDYGELQKGEYYRFERIISTSRFRFASPEVLTVIELEYKLQMEFCFGIIIKDNANYYTDENIGKFEELIYKLPEYPESLMTAKNRYLNELQKINGSYERYKNQSENYLRASENLRW